RHQTDLIPPFHDPHRRKHRQMDERRSSSQASSRSDRKHVPPQSPVPRMAHDPTENSMKRPRRKFLLLAAGAAALTTVIALVDHAAWSQSARTIKIVVPFPPGGSADTLARLLGEQVSKANGPTVVIENRPGAGAVIAYEAVARAAPD